MKIIKKLFKILVATIMLLSSTICNFVGIGVNVQAATFYIDEASLYSKGTYSDMITYNDINIETTFVVYKKDGREYPAYCINPGLDGVGEQGTYNVKVSSLLNDVNLWRVVTNGYPYKSVSELGCNTAVEAFVATKHAVYCALLNREASWYGTIGEAGVRVKNAMETILRNAKSGSAGKPSSIITINEIDSTWKEDASWNGYISKTFDITAETSYDSYTVSLEGNYPEETRIADTSNNLKSNFSSGDKFKIAIPIRAISNSGSFKIKVVSKLATKPVLYGKSPNSSLQDYALTASIYEDGEGDRTVYFSKNETKLEIVKQEDKTLKKLKGVEFRILDSNKKPAYTNLITNENGKITITNMLPGTYYLEEVKALDGYAKYDKQIKFNIELNQTLTINVNNTLEKRKEDVTNVQNINVSNSKEEIIVKENKEYTNRVEIEKTIDESHTQKNILDTTKTEKDSYNTVVTNATKNFELVKRADNVSLSNKDININKLEQNLVETINNENVNINENKQNMEVKVNNSNNNVNLNKQNVKTDVKNENNNTNINKQLESKNIVNKNNNINGKDVTVHAKSNNSNARTNTNINVNTNINTNSSSNTNQNNNENISIYNGVVKLPKTGM